MTARRLIALELLATLLLLVPLAQARLAEPLLRGSERGTLASKSLGEAAQPACAVSPSELRGLESEVRAGRETLRPAAGTSGLGRLADPRRPPEQRQLLRAAKPRLASLRTLRI